jgi:hypothetical protein
MLRQLGEKEQWSLQINKLMPLNVTFAFTLTGMLSEFQIQQGLNSILKKYQALRVYVKDSHFYEMSFNSTVSLLMEGEYNLACYNAAIHAETHTAFTLEQGPMLRARLFVKTHEEKIILLLTYCHLVVDGRSALNISIDLIRYLYDKTLTSESIPLLNSVEDCLPALTQTSNSGQQVVPSDAYSQFAASTTASLHTEFYRQIIPADLATKMTTFSKTHHLSLTALISAMWLLATYQDICQSQKTQSAIWFNYSTMVDLRKYMQIKDKRSVANFVKPLPVQIELTPQYSLKDIAEIINLKLHHIELDNAKLQQNNKIELPRIGLSNVGNIDPLMKDVHMYVEDITAYNAIHAFFNNEYSFASACLSYKNKIQIIISYPVPITDYNKIDKIYKITCELI